MNFADAPPKSRHLLVVDDDDRIRELLKEYLTRAGFRVTGAPGGDPARRLLATLDFDLAIFDVMMPGEDGFSLTRWLRQQRGKAGRTPVLMLTALGEAGDRIEGLKTGAANLGWSTGTSTLENHPDTVRAFLRAMVKATMRMRQDKAFTMEVMTSAPYRMDPRTAEESWELHRGHWMMRMDTARGDFDFDIEKAAKGMNVPLAQMPREKLVAAEPIRAVLGELGVNFG